MASHIFASSDSLEDGIDFEIVGEVEKPPENGSHQNENGSQKGRLPAQYKSSPKHDRFCCKI
jgi:hypothetical protein